VLIIARHGRTPENAAGQLLGRRDPALDEVGRQQAAAIAELVAQTAAGSVARPLLVVSSPLVRCLETAQAVCERIERRAEGPPEVSVDRRLIEVDYGELEGMAVGDVPVPIRKRWRADPSWAPAGGESLLDVFERVSAALDDLSARSCGPGSGVEPDGGSDIVIVTHVSPIKAAVGWALGVGPEISWRCHVAQASVHRIDPAGGTPRLMSFNETHHLAP